MRMNREGQIIASRTKILVECINPTISWMEDFVTLLCEDTIAEEKMDHLLELVAANRISDAMNEIIELARNRDNGLQDVAAQLSDEMLADELSEKALAISQLLLRNWDDSDLADLCLLWDNIVENKDLAKSIVTRIWKESEDSDCEWPYELLHNSLTSLSGERDKIKEFIAAFTSASILGLGNEQGAALVKECLSKIFVAYMNPMTMKKLMLKLLSKRAITKDQRIALVQKVEENQIVDTIREMIDTVANADRGLDHFVEVLKAGTVPIEEKAVEMIVRTIQQDLNVEQMKLIVFWPQLIAYDEDIKRQVLELWQDMPGLVEKDWPKHFIHFCVTSNDNDITRIKTLVSNISRKTFMLKDQPAQKEEQQHSGLVSEQLDDDTASIESFEVLNTEELAGKPTSPLFPAETAGEHDQENNEDDGQLIGSMHKNYYSSDDDVSFLIDKAHLQDMTQVENEARLHEENQQMKNLGNQDKDTADELREVEQDQQHGGDDPESTVEHSENQSEPLAGGNEVRTDSMPSPDDDSNSDMDTSANDDDMRNSIDDEHESNSFNNDTTDIKKVSTNTPLVTDQGNTNETRSHKSHQQVQTNITESGDETDVGGATPSRQDCELQRDDTKSVVPDSEAESSRQPGQDEQESYSGTNDDAKKMKVPHRVKALADEVIETADESRSHEGGTLLQNNTSESHEKYSENQSEPRTDGDEVRTDSMQSSGDDSNSDLDTSANDGNANETRSHKSHQQIQTNITESGDETDVGGAMPSRRDCELQRDDTESVDSEAESSGQPGNDEQESYSGRNNDAKKMKVPHEVKALADEVIETADEAGLHEGGTLLQNDTSETQAPFKTKTAPGKSIVNQPHSRIRNETELDKDVAFQTQLEIVMAQSRETENTRMGSDSTIVEFRVYIADSWTNEGWHPFISFRGGNTYRMTRDERSGRANKNYFFQTWVKSDGQSLYYVYSVEQIPGIEKAGYYECLPMGCFWRQTKVKRGVRQIIMDMALIDQHTAGKLSSLEKFSFYLPHEWNEITVMHNDIEAWFWNAFHGRTLVTQKGGQYTSKFEIEKIQKITEEWLQKFMKKRGMMFVTCCVLTLVAFENGKQPIADGLRKILVKGLQIGGIDQRKIYENLTHILETRTLLTCLKHFMEKSMKCTDVSIILVLPLYRLILCNGEMDKLSRFDIYGDEMLEKRALLPEDMKWRDFHGKVVRNSNKTSKLLKLSKSILDISQTHSYMIDTYHYFLDWKLMISLIKKKDDVAAEFQIDSLVRQILPLRQFEDEELRNIMSVLESNLEGRFNDHINAINITDTYRMEQSKRKVENLLSSIADEIHWYGSKKCDLTHTQQRSLDWLLCMAESCFNWLHALQSTSSDLEVFYWKILLSVRQSIYQCDGNDAAFNIKEIKFFNTLLKKNWWYKEFDFEWKKSISDGIKSCIDKRCKDTDDETFLEMYAKIASEQIQNVVDAVLQHKAADCLLRWVKTVGNKTGVSVSISKLLCLGASNPFVAAFEKTFKKHRNKSFEIQTLNFLAESEMALMLYETFDFEIMSKLIESANSKKLSTLHEEVLSVSKKISERTISVGGMTVIRDHRQRMEKMLCLIEAHKRNSGSSQTSDEIKQMITAATDILTLYSERCEAVASFIEFCNSIPNIEVKSDSLHGMDKVEAGRTLQEAGRCDIDEEHMNDMKLIHILKGSMMLTREKAEHMKSQDTSCIGWKKVLDEIWQNVKDGLVQLVSKLQSGSMNNNEISCAFKSFKSNPGTLEKEMYLLMKFWNESRQAEVNEEPKTVDALVTTISHIFKVERQKEFIKWMVEFTKNYKLPGDFQILEEKTLLRCNLEDLSKFEMIPTLTADQFRNLEGFTNQHDLIEWLQHYPKGKEGLEALCLIAGESCRYNNIGADRWLILKESIAAFSDLLFDLRNISGIRHLIERCMHVLKNIDDDSTIMTKWSDTGQHWSWYKENQSKHASEELSALEFARKAIREGTYMVGKLSDASVPDLAQSILLRFSQPGNTDTEIQSNEEEKITIDKLHDYQSILTLITNEGKESADEIRQYSETLSAMEGLAKSYVDLINAGFILFSKWKMIVSPSRADSSNITLDSIFKIWMTFIDGEGNLGCPASIKDINVLSDEMKKTLIKWEKHISDMRIAHYYLNEYNIHQIRYLCENLGRSHQHTFDDQVYLLLSSAPRHLLVKHIRDSLDEALAFSADEEENFDIAQEYQSANSSEQRNRKLQQAVRHLVMKENLSEKLAKAAVQAEGSEDSDNCMNWVMLHEFDEDEIDKYSKKFDQAIGFVHNASDTQEDESALQDKSVTTVTGMISHLQRKVRESDITTAVKTIITGYLNGTKGVAMKDYLSVHHLGKFLTILRQRLGETPTPRILHFPFKRGTPNLIITDKQDIIPRTLSLYCVEKESELPNSNEVLLCSANTTEDEVERFILRAMCKYSSLQNCHQIEEIYCEKMHNMVLKMTVEEELPYKMAKAAVQAKGCDDMIACVNWAKVNYTNEREVAMLCKEFDEAVGASPIFCIAFMENLEFNASKALDMAFETHAGSKYVNGNYQLVLITSSSTHYTTVSFAKHQVSPADIAMENIRDFVTREMGREGIPQQPYAKVVASKKSGMGKSLHVKRVCEKLPHGCRKTTVRLLDKTIDMQAVVQRLCKDQVSEDPKLIHIDISQAVENDLEKFIFDLLILGQINDKFGRVWRRRENHSYIIEATKVEGRNALSQTLNLLPTLMAIPPEEVLTTLFSDTVQENGRPATLSLDETEYWSDAFQRTVHYLKMSENNQSMTGFTYQKDVDAIGKSESISLLLRHCGIIKPTWAQLKHFVTFLNALLENCEKSSFFEANVDCLEGLKELAVTFMIKLARDFATPSLAIADESSSHAHDMEDNTTNQVDGYQLRRKWEEQDHSYMFFNDDGHTMTFINVNIDYKGNLMNKDGSILEEGITSRNLVQSLRIQGYKFGFHFQSLSRNDKLQCLRNIMGIKDGNEEFEDPDETYELTTDNVLKMIAIYMRLRCGIPVIIMGETGCGKTRMVEFISKLQAVKHSKGSQSENGYSKVSSNPMRTLKVHGGMQAKGIHKSVIESLKCHNSILFFDEANTTTAIYAIKEIMCDLSVDGDTFKEICQKYDVQPGPPLQVIAACNPYKLLSKKALANLEKSGLGYRIPNDAIKEKFGNIAMRMLVYKVVALPPGIQPFVFDFGQLSEETECIYIKNMIAKAVKNLKGLSQEAKTTDENRITKILSRVQSYVRNQEQECRYVSLRDIERTIVLLRWFLEHGDIFTQMDIETQSTCSISKMLRCLIHAIGISYHVSLQNRSGLRNMISETLSELDVKFTPQQIEEEYKICQNIFHRDLKAIGDHIAWNEALRENVLLMAICADTKLPLYIIGKPGSSKSLAKSIIDINMKGKSSTSSIFKKLKQVEMHSFQCSAQTDTEGIERVFKRAVHRQENQDLKIFTSLVVLDEIGLAEDSPNMPLKILHPLLECGSATSGTLTEHEPQNRVAFVGISNWALDPAKMNRGIFVTRSTPLQEDLFKTAQSICDGNMNAIHTKLKILTTIYLEIYKEQNNQFFGLRDYYSMIKMVHSLSKKHGGVSDQDLLYVLTRNFSGGSKKHKEIVKRAIIQKLPIEEWQWPENYDVGSIISESVRIPDCNSRFLLLLTKHYSSMHLLNYILPDFKEKAHILFGSEFPGDHTYNELCKTIKTVKACIEQGKLVVSLNMVDIHESLYDVLNQHYFEVGTQKYVAIGLGSRRVWTKVHEKFRMIFIEKEDVAYKTYPIPLLNRLEKHHLATSSLLTDSQNEQAKQLSKWVMEYSTVGDFKPANSFLGFHEDTVGSVTLMCTESTGIDEHKDVMLQMATPDSIFRLPRKRHLDVEDTTRHYMDEQVHDSLFNLLKHTMEKNAREASKIKILEVVSFSNVLAEGMRKNIESSLKLSDDSVMLVSLQQFKVMQDYTKSIDDFFKRSKEIQKKSEDIKSHPKDTNKHTTILLIQSCQAHVYGQLIECAKYHLNNKLQEEKANLSGCKIIVVFILATERNASLSLQPTPSYKTIYIDELGCMQSNTHTTLLKDFYGKTIVDIFREGVESMENSNSVHCILQDCIVDAVSKSDDPSSMNDWQVNQIKVLRELTNGDKSNDPEISDAFLKCLFEKMSNIVQSFFESNEEDDNWILHEAISATNLQEGGTFGKTIHLRLKHEMARVLSVVISVINENGNLNILTKRKSDMDWKCELWFRVFESYNFERPTNSQIEYSAVASRVDQSKGPCKFPFSSLLTRVLQKMYDDGEKSKNKETFFYNKVSRCKERHVSMILDWCLNTTKSEELEDMMKSYANDLVCSYFSHLVRNQDDLYIITEILYKFSLQKWYDSREKNGLGLAFFILIEKKEHFKTICQVLRIYPGIKNQAEHWINEQKNEKTFKVHVYALQCLLDEANKRVIAISDEESCMEWLATSALIRQTYFSSLDMIECQKERKDLMNKWKPVRLLDTMLMWLLPWNVQHPDHKNYLKIIVKQAKNLLQAMQRFGFHSKNVLKVMTTISRKMYEQLKFNLKINWQYPPFCQCGGELEPAFQMPCNQYVCRICSMNAGETTKVCPACYKTMDENFKVCQAELSENQEKKLRAFKANITGFFLRYLYDYCFDDEGDEDLEIKANMIFHNMIYQDKESTPTDGNPKLETEQLDLNIATKSNILGLLKAKHGEIYIEDLNRAIKSNAVSDDLIATILRTLQDEYSATLSDGDISAELSRDLSRYWHEMNQSPCDQINGNILYKIAVIRFSLTEFVKSVDPDVSNNMPTPPLTLRVKDLGKKDHSGILKDFVMRAGFVHYGTRWFDLVRTIPDLQPLDNFTPEKEETTKLDLWTAFGNDYSEFCKSGQELEMLQQEIPSDAQKDLPKILAIFQNPRLIEGLQTNLMESEWKDLVEGSRTLQRHIANITSFTERQKHEIYMLVTSATAMVRCGTPFTQQLHLILTDPAEASDLYWPGMPRYLYHEINLAMEGEAAYTCPEGHVYYIGNCTLPWMTSQCPECHRDIGGMLHVAAEGNRRLATGPSSGKSYRLHDNVQGFESAGNRVTPQAAEVIQFFIHSCMIMALLVKGTSEKILRILGKRRKNQTNESLEFLMNKVRENVEKMAKNLGCTVDDGVLLLQELIVRMSANSDNEENVSSWETAEECNNWELAFREMYVQPVFHEDDDVITKAKHRINGSATKRQITTYQNKAWTYRNPALWQPFRDPSTEHLMHSIIDSPISGSVLKAILTTPNLQYVKQLQDVLKLQRMLISKYQYMRDMKDVEKITFSRLKEENNADLKQLINAYKELWNQIYPSLAPKYGTDKTMKEYWRKITDENAITFAIPHTRGKGKCAKLLAEYLINTQNDFLDKCIGQDETIQGIGIAAVEVSKLQDSHFVCVDKQKDLLPMIRMHTSYAKIETPCGTHHRITYNIPALEKQVKEAHVIYKKRIVKESLPCIRYADTGIGLDWDIVNETIPQEALSQQLAQAINEQVEKTSLAEICEGVRTLTQAISFLAKIKTSMNGQNRKLRDYLQHDLMLTADHMTMIPRSTEIVHTLALYKKLTWHKAVRFIRQGLNPYKEYLPEKQQEPITNKETLMALKNFFESTDVGLLQEHINEMLIKTDFSDMKPDWRLKDILPILQYLQDETDDSFYEKLPEEICLKHVAYLFRLLVEGIAVADSKASI